MHTEVRGQSHNLLNLNTSKQFTLIRYKKMEKKKFILRNKIDNDTPMILTLTNKKKLEASPIIDD